MEKTVLSANTILQGRYRIIQLLGHGGMGAVYEAVDENLRCRVTIKETFATDAERDVRKAFAREAQLLANIRHPAVPKVSDYFEQGDGLFFVMEFIRGVNLEEALKLRGGPFPLRDVLGWADALLAALAELHSADPPIVHKDIKPSNLKRSPKGEIFLLDFGLAKGALGQMSTVRGENYSNLQGHTPHFAPPEQIARTGTTPRSDLYSLAATLWCLLTNRLPDDATRRNYYIGNNEPDPLRPAHEFNAEVPRTVSAVLEQALSLNVTKRPANAEEMRETLREAVEAPLRAQAERARREEEEKIRREAEEEFARRLEEERAAHAAALAEARRESEDERALRVRLEEESARLKDRLKKSSAELKSARGEAAAERERLKRAEASLAELASSTAKKESAFEAAEERALRLTSERDEAVREARQFESLLQQRLVALRQAEKERDEALARPQPEAATAAAATKEVGENGRRRVSFTRALTTSVLLLLAAVALPTWLTFRFADGKKTHEREEAAASATTNNGAAASASPAVETFRVDVGGVALEMVKVRGGTFMMGSPDAQTDRELKEKPWHQVTAPDFNVGAYEVTQAQWRAVTKMPKVRIDLKDNVSYFKGDDLPVDTVSWNQAVEFCERLSKATGVKYRLPTEAEWEYAARGGREGAVNADLDSVSWNADNSGKHPIDSLQLWNSSNQNTSQYQSRIRGNGGRTHVVGQKRANALGLYDTLGNVWEWCLDSWHDNYKGAPGDASEWTVGGDSTLRVERGGSWFHAPKFAHPAVRWHAKPDGRFFDLGFRVVSVPQ